MIAANLLQIIALGAAGVQPAAVALDGPRAVQRYEVAEYTLQLGSPFAGNPFRDVRFTGEFSLPGKPAAKITGFCDSADGSTFRLRFCPDVAGATYQYAVRLSVAGDEQRFDGTLACLPGDGGGAVISDPRHPRHFVYAGSNRPFYHLGYTAYHLLDPAHDEAAIATTIDYCAREGYNKIRFLLTGYPRDSGGRTSGDVEHGLVDPTLLPNYGATRPILALPAWPGEPHHYDFTRFNVAHWQRIDRAVVTMRKAGIVATCIITIEKQDLPKEYGRLSEAEYGLYRYAVARLAAFDNVWFDLGNEHNEYRDRRWGDTMGAFVRQEDPYGRLASAHAYADFLYPRSSWPGFIITQQYGQEREVYDWVLKYRDVPLPYVNEECGYEGRGLNGQKSGPDGPGHGQSSDRTRRTHWSIAMAGGYSTYGDGSGGVSYYYMGMPGPGVAARQLKYMRRYFEGLPFRDLQVDPQRTSGGFCLRGPDDHFTFYLPRGGEAAIRLPGAGAGLNARWFDPRTGDWQAGPALEHEVQTITAPTAADWVLDVRRAASSVSTQP